MYKSRERWKQVDYARNCILKEIENWAVAGDGVARQHSCCLQDDFRDEEEGLMVARVTTADKLRESARKALCVTSGQRKER